GRESAGLRLDARLAQLRRAQQAADLVGVKGGSCHVSLLAGPSLARAPGAGDAREARAARHAEVAAAPGVALDVDSFALDAQHVEGIRFSPRSHRRGGAGLHYERRILADRIAPRGVADMARVQMPGEQDVG